MIKSEPRCSRCKGNMVNKVRGLESSLIELEEKETVFIDQAEVSFPARCTCHVWHAHRTLRPPLPVARATRGLTPHAPPLARRMCHAWHAAPPARRTCHTWHAHRTLRPLPGAHATCGMHTTRSALCLGHVPRVAYTPHSPPPFPVHVPQLAGPAPARRMCHAWDAHRTIRPLAWRTCHAWHARRTRRTPARCMCHVWLLTARAAPLPGA